MKNLELKKMSLAAVENKLSAYEMEEIMAGSGVNWGCVGAVVGVVSAFAGAFVTTTPVGAAIFAVGFINSSIGLSACR